MAVAPPLVAAGYSFLRNAELEPYMGTALWTRVLICSAVYAGSVGGELYLKTMLLDEGQSPELFHLLMIVPGLMIPGALAAMATLDLDGLFSAIHYAFYLAATVFLRWCAGLHVLLRVAEGRFETGHKQWATVDRRLHFGKQTQVANLLHVVDQDLIPVSSLSDIPELVAMDARSSLVRIPPQTDVPLTPRVRRIIDTRRRFVGWQPSANWVWCHWFIPPPIILASSIPWAYFVMPCCT